MWRPWPCILQSAICGARPCKSLARMQGARCWQPSPPAGLQAGVQRGAHPPTAAAAAGTAGAWLGAPQELPALQLHTTSVSSCPHRVGSRLTPYEQTALARVQSSGRLQQGHTLAVQLGQMMWAAPGAWTKLPGRPVEDPPEQPAAASMGTRPGYQPRRAQLLSSRIPGTTARSAAALVAEPLQRQGMRPRSPMHALPGLGAHSCAPRGGCASQLRSPLSALRSSCGS